MAFALALGACATSREASRAVPPPSLEKIADGVWIHKSYKDIPPYGPFLSQGMVIRRDDIVVLVDTAWNDADTERLLTMIRRAANNPPSTAILTHAHDDKMGGMAALHAAAIRTHAHRLTNEDAPLRGLAPAMFVMESDDEQFVITSGRGEWITGDDLTMYYPGPGHTRDNIVVYYAPAKALFGGCLIRPKNATDLGNTADADIANWADAVRKVAERFPDAEIVVPSHGPYGGRELLDHTIALAEAAAKSGL